jgi:aminoglycoside phosphotransferase (APT) family kinase protein
VTITASEVSVALDTPRVARELWEFVADSGLESLVCATSKDPNAKVTVLLVSPQTGKPVLAVKAPTTAAAERAVDAEARVLEELGRLRLGAVAGTIPRLVEVVEFEQRRAPVMSALPGRPLSTAYAERGHTRDSARVAADFGAAGDWLTELQQATAGETAPVDLDAGVVARLRERFADDRALESDLTRLEAMHARLRRSRVPRTVVHGDFWVGNILTSNGRVSGVVDWEAAAVSGEPVRDLVRFANMYALYLDRGVRRGEWGAGLEHAIYGSGWFPALYRSFLEDGLERLGADPDHWQDAALAGIAEVAALTDHEEFAGFHLELFRRLSSPEVSE